jgi:hypothetical protein
VDETGTEWEEEEEQSEEEEEFEEEEGPVEGGEGVLDVTGSPSLVTLVRWT